MDVELRSPVYKITAIHHKTRTKGLEKAKVGDTVMVTMKVRNTSGASGGGNYATYLNGYLFPEDGGLGSPFRVTQSAFTQLFSHNFEIEPV